MLKTEMYSSCKPGGGGGRVLEVFGDVKKPVKGAYVHVKFEPTFDFCNFVSIYVMVKEEVVRSNLAIYRINC